MSDKALAIVAVIFQSLLEMLLAGAVGWEVYKWQHNADAGLAAAFALMFWEYVRREANK